jgi:CubicO group peptidase (beta-lactamase class C family)
MVRDVFEPLAMARTVVAETEDVDVAAASPKSIFRIGHSVKKPARPDYSCLAGAGAFLSTPTDLVRLGSAMLKPGLLKAETIVAFETRTRLISGVTTTYALGWTVASVPLAAEPRRMVSHRGSPAGGAVSLVMFPDVGLAIAVATNVTHPSGLNPFALQVAEAFTRRTRLVSSNLVETLPQRQTSQGVQR